MKFQDAFEIQKRVHHCCSLGLIGDTTLLVEHPKVLTLGKNATTRFITASALHLEALRVEVIRIDRGGEVTAHMPGQLVAYPIMRLSTPQLGPKAYVGRLEATIISLLHRHGIMGYTDPINSGVWVDQQKICAVGIRVSKRVTLHGLALNVNNELELFSAIVPCGIQGRKVTCMKDVLGENVDLDLLRQDFLSCFSNIFAYESMSEIALADLENELDAAPKILSP